MRKTSFLLLTGVLFFGSTSFALANISFDSGASSDPQPQFAVNCSPYTTTFVEGGYYQPADGSPCTYYLPAQQMSSSSIFMAVYKGTVGHATLINFDFGPEPGHSILTTSPNSFFGAVQDDDYFSVAVSYDDFNDLLAEDAYFGSGGASAPLPYSAIAWKWGVAPSTGPVDTTAPVITLLGSASVSVQAGTTYTDAGATALDDTDGNITSSITTSNTVNMSHVGNYTVTYGVLDSHGNAATPISRAVTVTPAPLTVTADNKSMYPNTPIPALTSSLSGFIGNDTADSNDVSGSATCSTTATSGSPVGSYPITCTKGSLTSANYIFTNFVAGTLIISPPPPTRCLWSLSASGTGVQMNGSGQVVGVGCVMQVNSSSASAVTLNGSAKIQTVKNCVVGDAKTTGKAGLSPDNTNCGTVSDPFASIQKPVVPATCDFTNYTHSGSGAVSLSPGTYCGGMKFSGSNKITFAPGIYILKNGPLVVSGSEQLTGSGVSFFLTGTNAGITSSGSASWHISAPLTGLLRGFAVFLDGSSSGISASSQFSGSSNLYIEGVVYLPKQTLMFSGSDKILGTSPFTSLIADKFIMSGSGTFNLNGTTAQSSVPVSTGLYFQ